MESLFKIPTAEALQRVRFTDASREQRVSILAGDAFEGSAIAEEQTVALFDGSEVRGVVEKTEPAALVVWSVEGGVYRIPVEFLKEPPSGAELPDAASLEIAREMFATVRALARMYEADDGQARRDRVAVMEMLSKRMQAVADAAGPVGEENERLKIENHALREHLARLETRNSFTA